MKKIILLSLFILVNFISIPLYASDNPIVLEDIQYQDGESQMGLSLTFSEPVEYVWYVSDDKKMLIIDPVQSVSTQQRPKQNYNSGIQSVEIQSPAAEDEQYQEGQRYDVDFITVFLSSIYNVTVQPLNEKSQIMISFLSQDSEEVKRQVNENLARLLSDYIEVKSNDNVEHVQVAYKESSHGITQSVQDVPHALLPSKKKTEDQEMKLAQLSASEEEMSDDLLYDAPILLDLVLEEDEGEGQIEILFDTNPEYTAVYDKEKKVITINPSSFIFTDLPLEFNFNKEIVSKVLIVQKETKKPLGLDDSFFGVDTIEIYFNKEVEYVIQENPDEGTLTIDVLAIEEEMPIEEPAKDKEPEKVQKPFIPKERTKIEPQDKVITAAPILLDLLCDNYNNMASIVVTSDVTFQYVEYSLEEPFRLIIDPVTVVFSDLEKQTFYNNGIVKSIKLVPQEVQRPDDIDESFYGVDAVVIEFVSTVSSVIEQKGSELVLTVNSVDKHDAVPTVVLDSIADVKVDVGVVGGKVPEFMKETKFQELPKHPVGQFPELEKVKKDWDTLRGFSLKGKTLEDCIQLGYFNNRQIIVALEEMKLSKMKVFEAKRALFPNVKLKTTITEGTTSGLKFNEKRFGLEGEQPVYYSFRLINTYKQAKLNLQVSAKKLEKIKLDVSQKVTESFNNLQKSYITYQQHYSLLKRAEYVYKLSESLFNRGMVTEMELLNVQSQLYQVIYQIESARRDLELNRLKFQKEMALPYDEEIVDIRPDFIFKKIDVDLSSALQLAYGSRPDVIINNMLIRVSYLGHKIAKAKEDWKFSISGFAGKSGSAYQTEKLRLKKDWTVGFKIQKGFWGNNADYSFSKNKTAPKLGQNDRTDSGSHEISVGLLDGLAGQNEIQKARVEFLKSIDDKMTLDSTVRVEVQESYYNYKKALLQLENITNKIRIKLKEMKITKLQAAYHEIPQSKLLETYIRLSEEFTQYYDTLNNYKNAINSLNKAIGIVSHYK